jgi:hypothetical protein
LIVIVGHLLNDEIVVEVNDELVEIFAASADALAIGGFVVSAVFCPPRAAAWADRLALTKLLPNLAQERFHLQRDAHGHFRHRRSPPLA